MLPVLALTATLALHPACPTSCPPQQQVVKIANPGRPPLWINFTGTGSGAPDGLQKWVALMVPDGFNLTTTAHDCGWKKNPCVIQVPSNLPPPA